MSFSNYEELCNAVGGWLNRGDLSDRIPDFIRLAESDFNRVLRTRDMMERSTAAIVDQYTPLPEGFREMKNLQINAAKPYVLEYMTPSNLDRERRENHSVPGKPLYYTIVGDAIEVCPSPDTEYEAEMAFYESIPYLGEDQETNWLLEKHPDLYLYGTLMHSAPFLHDDERVQTWAAAHDRIMASILMEEDKAAHSGSTPLKARFKPI